MLWQEDEMEVAQPEEPQDFRGHGLDLAVLSFGLAPAVEVLLCLAAASRMRRTRRLPELRLSSGSGARLCGFAEVQVASLLCSPGSPSSPPALQDAPPSDPSLQVVPVGEAAKEIGDGGDRDLALALALPARPLPLPNEIPPAGPTVPLPEAPGRRVVARASKRRSALPAVPRLPPLPDGDLIESFSDNPLQNALQEPGPGNGQESCMPEGVQRAPRAPSELEAGLHAIRSPGFKELKELNLPPASNASTPRDHPKPKRALTSFAGKHVIDVTDFDVGPNPKRRREGAKSSDPLKGQAGNTASGSYGGSYGSQRSSRLRKSKPQKDPRRVAALLFSQRMSQLSQSLSQKLKANGRTPRRSIRVRKGGWILARGPQGSDPNPGKPAPLGGLPSPLMSAPSAPERPDVLFTGFARSDLHALRTSVNCLGGGALCICKDWRFVCCSPRSGREFPDGRWQWPDQRPGRGAVHVVGRTKCCHEAIPEIHGGSALGRLGPLFRVGALLNASRPLASRGTCLRSRTFGAGVVFRKFAHELVNMRFPLRSAFNSLATCMPWAALPEVGITALSSSRAAASTSSPGPKTFGNHVVLDSGGSSCYRRPSHQGRRTGCPLYSGF